jgi:hypothetical protein
MMIRRLTPLLVLVGSIVALVASPAGAAAATSISGTYTATDFGATVCQPLSQTRLECTTTGFASSYEGDLEGTSTSAFHQVIDCARGKTVGVGSETFTGSIDGAAGTLTWQLWFTSDFDCTTFIPSNLRIVAVPRDGEGGLAGIHGVLLFGDIAYHGVVT